MRRGKVGDMPISSSFITTQRYLPSLEGWRGAMALSVAFYHFYGLFSAEQFLSHAYIGVDFFFILSGFIIARQYEADIVMRHITFRQFAVRRIARLYPLYIVSIAAFLAVNAYVLRPLNIGNAVAFGMGPLYAWRIMLQLTMLGNIGGMAEPWNGPAWSVSVEWIVNVLFFALVWHFKRVPKLVLWSAVAVCTVYLTYISPHSLNLFISDTPIFNPTLARGIVGFGLGWLLFRYHGKLPNFTTKFLHMLEVAIVLIGILLINLYAYPSLLGVDYLFQLILFPALIMISLYRQGWISRTFSCLPVRFLGRISYSVYLLHVPLGYMVVYSPYLSHLQRPASGILYVILLIMVSTVSYYAIEAPLQKLGRRWSK